MNVALPGRSSRLAIAGVLLAACTGERAADGTDTASEAAEIAFVTGEQDLSGRGLVLERRGGSATPPPPRPAGTRGSPQIRPSPQTIAAAHTMLIRSGSVSIRVDSIERAMDAVRGLAASLGATVAGVTMMNGEKQVRGASMELRVPSARFDELIAGVRPIGRVEHSALSAVDVGEEYVDISARVANARRLERRLVELLATRTGRLEDVLAVERELARVREEIERHEGRIRYLESRIAMSSVSVHLHEKGPLVAAHPGANPIRLAFVNMWRNFVLFVALGIEALGVAVPVALLVMGAVAGWKRWRRRLSAA